MVVAFIIFLTWFAATQLLIRKWTREGKLH
jgi:hypothetical protein